ncbi:MAG: protein kinase [Clostridia bacterium]|nr:protein kinase [Clostridia bacterium]
MVCKKCGAPLPEGAKFCKKCGERTGLAPVRPRSDLEPTVAADDANLSVNRAIDADVERHNALIKSIWPDWTVTQKLGEGSFGRVYRAEREDTGTRFASAIKVITIPQNQAQLDSVRSELGQDEQSTTSYFRAMVDDCVNEIKMMESFKGTQNIVSVEDYKVIPNKGSVGWTILIRMELLTSFISYSKNKVFTEQEVIKLGIDICNALEYCAKLDVMHRDIKPENIFVSNFGDFKLGDFGIARKLERSDNGMSRKGTYNYMAPEIYNGGKYDFKSDIYSLGIVLYKLMNNNRFPLVDPRTPGVTYQQMQAAFEQRMAGAAFQKPVNAGDAFSAVILTACAFNPNERFATATAMKQALLNVQSGNVVRPREQTARIVRPGPTPAQRMAQTQVARPVVQPPVPVAPPAPPAPPVVEKPPKVKKERKKMSKGKKALIAILAVLIVLLGLVSYVGITYFTSGEYKVLKALDAGDYGDAAAQYDADMNNSVFWLRKWFRSQIEKDIAAYKDDYLSGAMEKDKARNALSAIVDMNIPDLSDNARDRRDEIDALEASKTAFDKAEDYMNGEAPRKEDYLAAIEQYKLVKEYDENYATAQSRITDATNKYRDAVLAEAQAKADAGDLEAARVIVENGLENLPGDATLSAKLTEYGAAVETRNKQEILDAAAKSVEENDYKAALQTLKNALVNAPGDVDYIARQREYETKYEQYVLAQVAELLDAKDYAGATNALNEALSVLPNSETLQTKLDEVNAGKPVSLPSESVILVNKNFDWAEAGTETPQDPFGNSYGGTFAVFDSDYSYSYDKEFYQQYRVDGKYKKITGTFAPHADIPEQGWATIQIYVAGEDNQDILVEPPLKKINRMTDGYSFEVDITGAKWVKIVVTTNGESHNNCAILANVQLWEN